MTRGFSRVIVSLAGLAAASLTMAGFWMPRPTNWLDRFPVLSVVTAPGVFPAVVLFGPHSASSSLAGASLVASICNAIVWGTVTSVVLRMRQAEAPRGP